MIPDIPRSDGGSTVGGVIADVAVIDGRRRGKQRIYS